MAENSTLTSEMRCVWAIAWPLILTNLLNVVVGLVDFKMVGRLGVDSIAAVGMSRQISMFLMIVMLAVSGGSSVLIAHAYGAGDRFRVSRIAARTITFMLTGAILIVTPLGYFFSGPLLGALGAEEHVVALGSGYLKIIFLGSLFAMFNFALTGILLGVGKTKVSLVLLIGINLMNIVFNYVFIFGVGPIPAFGVAGAAMGTVASRALGCIPGVWILTTSRFPVQARFRDGLAFDLGLLKRILYYGGPRSMQGIVRNFSRLMVLRIITLLPDATQAVSAFTVAMEVKLISTFVGLAFMAATMSRVGRNMGRKDPDLAEKTGWVSAGMATAIMSVLGVVFLLFPEAIMRFFTDDGEVVAMGRSLFIILALTEPFMACAFALGGALRGGGDPISPFVYSSVSDLAIVAVLGYVLAIPMGMGFTGIVIAIAFSALTRAVPTAWTFWKGKWKSNEV